MSLLSMVFTVQSHYTKNVAYVCSHKKGGATMYSDIKTTDIMLPRIEQFRQFWSYQLGFPKPPSPLLLWNSLWDL